MVRKGPTDELSVWVRIQSVFSEWVANVAAAGFLTRYLSGPLPYVWRHITVNKMCWVRR